MRDRKAIIQRAVWDAIIYSALSAIICVALMPLFKSIYKPFDLYVTLFYSVLIPLFIVPAFSVRNSRLINKVIALDEKLEEISVKDSLTEILNRRGFFQKSEPFFNYAQRYNRGFSFVIIDIDHFKVVNEQYGHPCGDKVLRDIALLLKKNLRETDVIGRLGGEEFGVFLPEINLNDTLIVVERLRRVIAEQVKVCSENKVKLTVSIGICTSNTKGICTIYDAYNLADIALYTAKLNGRDRYEIYAIESA